MLSGYCGSLVLVGSSRGDHTTALAHLTYSQKTSGLSTTPSDSDKRLFFQVLPGHRVCRLMSQRSTSAMAVPNARAQKLTKGSCHGNAGTDHRTIGLSVSSVRQLGHQHSIHAVSPTGSPSASRSRGSEHARCLSHPHALPPSDVTKFTLSILVTKDSLRCQLIINALY